MTFNPVFGQVMKQLSATDTLREPIVWSVDQALQLMGANTCLEVCLPDKPLDV